MAKKQRTPASEPSPAPAIEDASVETADRPVTPLSFPVVGIGASAGGLEAFTLLLRALPVDTGMAFVLVQHLAPSRDSALAEILSRATSMPVTEITHGGGLEPNHVYVIPPDRDMVFAERQLRLLPREERGAHHSIDLFFRSLAQDQREAAIGVVLSGSATDGTLGLEAIKAEGGITFAQDDSAQYDSMPRSAVASGCVDFTLPPEGIAKELARIATHPYVAGATNGKGQGDPRTGAEPDRAALAPILNLLRSRTDVDFSLYKMNTLSRRIARRMVLLKLDGVRDYERHLRETPDEVETLFQDVLINVTSFFRDPEVYEAIKARVIPALLKAKSRQDPVRVWVVGCSTGEEAYSLAMSFSEAMESASGPGLAQVFATDINSTSIDHARAGVYDKPRLLDVSRERLRRFFNETGNSYRVAKHIRDMCVFARHNVMADPPFSRMDLISCRNLLIYLEPAIQQRIIPAFHYALKPAGHLMLGASETVGQFRDLFEPEDSKLKIYRRKPGHARIPLGPPMPRPRAVENPDEAKARRSDPSGTEAARVPPGFASADVPREADRLLLARFAPPGVLVNSELEILQFRGNTEPYLVPAQGKASLNLLKMARPGLLVPVQALMHRAKKDFLPARGDVVRFKSDGGDRELQLEIVPIRGSTPSEPAFLVLFEDLARVKGAQPDPARGKGKSPRAAPVELSAATIARLEQEVATTREYLQSLLEQQDAANEELQSANEEAQSSNEELQSINEELETSKEEIQSSNEELTTVNDELANRNLEAGQLNSDLANLISSIHTAIVIVGRDLRIRRSSPMAGKILNIIPGDVGRPITDIRTRFDIPDLDSLLSEAIETVGVIEREVQDQQGCWYSLRVRPYMTLDNKIDGAVLMLLEMDRLKRAEEAAAAARDQAANVIASVRGPLLVLDADLRVETTNPAFQRVFGLEPAEATGQSIFAMGNRQWDIPRLRTLLEEILPRDATVENFRVEHELPGRGRRTMLLNARRINNPEQKTERILLAIEDITEQLHFQAAVRHSELRYRRLFETARDGVLLLDPVSRKIVDANPFMSELLGYAHEELVGKELFEIGLLKDEADSQAAFRELREKGFIRYEDLPLESKSGQRREVEMVSNLYTEAEDNVIQCNIRDITERKHSEAAMLRSERELSERVEELAAIDSAKGRFLAVLAHELRSPLNAIRGWLQILQRPGRTEQDLVKGLEVIDRNSKIQIDLISDLLDAHRIGAGKAALELRSIDLHDSIEAALATAEPAAAEMEILLERDIDHAPAPVSADPGRLQQVLGNLLTNALKFTPQGGRIRISMCRTDTHVEVSVADTGEGISAEALPHIFEPYRQAEAEAGRGHGGLGLGLTIAKQILMLHGGSIEARSPGHGQGATFTITLPLRGAGETARPAVLPAGKSEQRPGVLSGLLVLVVDDEPDAREPVRRVLEEAGAEVVAVASADEALEAVRQQRPDVLLSDIGMPGQDGYALIRSIRALPPGRGGRVPAIALTAYAADEDRDRALQAGYRTHLAKPVEPAVLIAAIAELASPSGGALKLGAK